MTKFLRLAFFLVVACAATFGQSRAGETNRTASVPARTPETKQLDLGRLEGNAYANDFFGISLSVPPDWVIVTAQRQGEIAQESKKMIGSQDPKKQTEINASIDRSTMLLSLTKLPAGQPGNAAFMLIAEKIPSPLIKNGADVIRSIASVAKGTNFTVEFQDGVRTEQIAGMEFGVATMKNKSPYGAFMQKAYVTTKHGYALQLFYTYLDEADLPTFDSIIKSIKPK